jgi:hypothetical protein
VSKRLDSALDGTVIHAVNPDGSQVTQLFEDPATARHIIPAPLCVKRGA